MKKEKNYFLLLLFLLSLFQTNDLKSFQYDKYFTRKNLTIGFGSLLGLSFLYYLYNRTKKDKESTKPNNKPTFIPVGHTVIEVKEKSNEEELDKLFETKNNSYNPPINNIEIKNYDSEQDDAKLRTFIIKPNERFISDMTSSVNSIKTAIAERDIKQYLKKQTEEHLQDFTFHFFVLHQIDKVAGCVLYSENTNKRRAGTYINLLMATSETLASELLNFVIKQDLKIEPVIVESIESNDRTMINFLKKHGFQETKKNSTYYNGNLEMWSSSFHYLRFEYQK